MILSLLLSMARAEDPPVPEPAVVDEAQPDDPISRYRTRFDVLAERAIGTTSTPVEFDWRRTTAQVAVTGGFLFELNNFDSGRGGVLARVPTGGVLLEFGLSYAGVSNTPSSRLLALTPYRQPGRPNRLEVDFTVGLPLAEGVVTTFPKFFPAVEMVFNAYGGVRYLVYPTGWDHMKPGEVGGAILSPSMTQIEIDNLDEERLDSMKVDLGRYGLMFGFGNDLYFKPGVFLSPRFLLALPLLAPASQTDLLLWADFSLAIGVAF